MGDKEKPSDFGVLGLSPAPLFENLGDEERAFEETNPFPAAVRRGGSRKGVPNRRTEDFKRFYAASGFKDPLMFLGHVITIDTDELAEHLGCRRALALNMQRKAAADLAPYLHSKQPARLDLGEGEGLPMLVVGALERAAVAEAVASGALSIDGDWPEQKQEVTPSPDAASHGEASHGPEKSEE